MNQWRLQDGENAWFSFFANYFQIVPMKAKLGKKINTNPPLLLWHDKWCKSISKHVIRGNIVDNCKLEYQSLKKKWDTLKILPLTKNIRFLSYSYETWWNYSSQIIIFIKFHENGTKIVDFFTNCQFLNASRFFFIQSLIEWHAIHYRRVCPLCHYY